MDMDTSKLDAEMLSRFMDRHPDVAKSCASVNKHCLVYHRGCGEDTTSGYFLSDKVGKLLAALNRGRHCGL